MLDKRQFYIDGQWVNPSSSSVIEVVDPSTEEVCAVISAGSGQDVERAVIAARRAFASWSRTPLAERRALLEKLNAIMTRRLSDWGEAISLEMGAPIDFAIEKKLGVVGTARNWNTVTKLLAMTEAS